MNIMDLIYGKKDPREEEYQKWLQLQGGGGVPIREDYGEIVPSFDPSLPYDVPQDGVQQGFDQEGYDEAMESYDWKRRLKGLQNKRFMASLANVFAPRYPKQTPPKVAGPASRAFPEYMRMRYWS